MSNARVRLLVLQEAYEEQQRMELRLQKTEHKAEKYQRLSVPSMCGKASGVVKLALENEFLTKPQICSECGVEGEIVGHHPDYRLPLKIEWLCASCHCKKHPRSTPWTFENWMNQKKRRAQRRKYYRDKPNKLNNLGW